MMAPPGPGPGTEAPKGFFGLVRDIRAEAQNLQVSLLEISDKEKLTDPKVQATAVESALRESADVFAYNRAQIEQRFRQLRGFLENSPDTYDQYGDEVTHLENLWARVTHLWPSPGQDAASAFVAVARVSSLLDKLVYHCGLVTIPERANEHLRRLRVGQVLNFRGAFRDELPNDTDQVEVLQYLKAHPAAVEGVVDVGRALIYRASPSALRRYASYLFILIAIAAGAGAIYAFVSIGAWFRLARWPATPGRLGELLVGYLFFLLGGLVHMGVDALKQVRAQRGESAFRALDDWLVWFHVKELGIIEGVVLLWIGLLALAFLQPRVEWQTAFFVGYSIDSFLDLFLSRFTMSIPAQVEAIRAQLSGESRSQT